MKTMPFQSAAIDTVMWTVVNSVVVAFILRRNEKPNQQKTVFLGRDDGDVIFGKKETSTNGMTFIKGGGRGGVTRNLGSDQDGNINHAKWVNLVQELCELSFSAKMKKVAVLFYVYDLVSNRTEMVVPLFSSLSTAILP